MLFLLAASVCPLVVGQKKDKGAGPYAPAKGSAERQAILDALRADQQVVFQVHYLTVHNRWCWIDTTPLDKHGRPLPRVAQISCTWKMESGK